MDHLLGQNMGMKSIHAWIFVNWELIMGYATRVFILVRGWMGFSFTIREDMHNIIGVTWKWGAQIILLSFIL